MDQALSHYQTQVRVQFINIYSFFDFEVIRLIRMFINLSKVIKQGYILLLGLDVLGNPFGIHRFYFILTRVFFLNMLVFCFVCSPLVQVS